MERKRAHRLAISWASSGWLEPVVRGRGVRAVREVQDGPGREVGGNID